MQECRPLLLATLLIVGGVLAQAQQPTFRTGTEIVDLYVTVTDDDGRLVPSLVREDFVVFDDDEPQELTLFENEVRPITVAVMLDTSISTELERPLIMAGAEQFLIRMLPADRGRVGAFNDKIQLSPPEFIGDRDSLIRELDGLDFGNSTRLWDAVNVAIDSLTGVEGRRVVLVLSDGEDAGSDVGWRDVLRRAIAEEVMVYTIGLRATYFGQKTDPDRRLRDLARETGGGYFLLEESADLGPTFTRVSQELHSQYVLGFTPTERDGEVHELEVRVGQRGMEARSRRSYVAPSGN